MKPTFFIITLIAFIFSPVISFSQEVFSASGGNAEGAGGSVSFSAGQLFFITHTGTDGSVSEGVQQPWEISVVSSLKGGDGIDLISAFPNPVTDRLTLRVERESFENLNYELFDVTGKVVKTGLITGYETFIEMAGFTQSTFFLRVLDKNKAIKTFRLLKL
jgi:hypothetical protein